MILAEWPFNTPVVRQIEHSPLGVVQSGFLTIWDVTQMKLPAFGEKPGLSEF
jgi:hypothetical protein